MRVHNLYADANGQSHWRDIQIEWVEETPGGKLSKRLPASGIGQRQGRGCVTQERASIDARTGVASHDAAFHF